MAKITVRHAVAAAYGLLFGRPLTVLGLTWLPALGYLFGATWLIQHMTGVTAQFVPTTAGQFAHYAYLVYSAALLIATAAFGALIGVPLTRQAFGLREEQVAAHLVVSHREFKLFLALIRYYAVIVLAAVVFAVCAGIVISQSTRYSALHDALWLNIPFETWLNGIGSVTAATLLLAYTVRYGFFLDAIAAVEDHVRMGRARGLSQGNFLRLVTIAFVVGMPAAVLLFACEKTFGGFGVGLSPTHALASAGILALGLIVLHALFAGAAAGAYSEMAEAHVENSAQYEPAASFEPAAIYAAAASRDEHEASYEQTEAPQSAEDSAAQMEIATPEADNAAGAAQTLNWMAPPPDAHFGADPHDAQSHDPAQSADANVASMAEYARREIEKNGSVNGTAAQGDAQTVGFDGHPIEVPDHAQNAEFPAPPLDPAGAMAAQQKIYPPS